MPVLILRAEQMLAFREDAERQFLDRMARRLHDHYPWTTANLSEETLRERITEGIRRAEAYGLKSFSSLSMFVTLMFVAAPDFDEHPEIRKWLKARWVPPDNRMDVILKNTGGRVWEEISRNDGPDAWDRPRLTSLP